MSAPPWAPGHRARTCRLRLPDGGHADVRITSDGCPSPATLAALEELVRQGALAVRAGNLVPVRDIARIR